MHSIQHYCITYIHIKEICISLMSHFFIVFVELVAILQYIFNYQVSNAVLAILVNIAWFTKHTVYVSETRHCPQSRHSMLLSPCPYIFWLGWLAISPCGCHPSRHFANTTVICFVHLECFRFVNMRNKTRKWPSPTSIHRRAFAK